MPIQTGDDIADIRALLLDCCSQLASLADAELLRLPQAAFSQRAVELALHAALGVPQRFAVADQDKLGHETVKSW